MLCGCSSAPEPFDPEDPLKFERPMTKPRKPLGWAHTAVLQCEWKYIQVWAQAGPKGTKKLPELLLLNCLLSLNPHLQPHWKFSVSTMLTKTKFRPVCRWFSVNMLTSAESGQLWPYCPTLEWL